MKGALIGGLAGLVVAGGALTAATVHFTDMDAPEAQATAAAAPQATPGAVAAATPANEIHLACASPPRRTVHLAQRKRVLARRHNPHAPVVETAFAEPPPWTYGPPRPVYADYERGRPWREHGWRAGWRNAPPPWGPHWDDRW